MKKFKIFSSNYQTQNLETVARLQEELMKEKETVSRLQGKVREEKETVTSLLGR